MVDQNRSKSTDHSQRHVSKSQGICLVIKTWKKAVLALACEQSLDTHTTEHLSLECEPTLLAILEEIAHMEIVCII